MYHPTPLSGSSLPERTLCLTYDDGPGRIESAGDRGPNTLKLARFLNRRGIRAAFFMVGKHAERYPDLVAEVRRLGHIVGNHTYSHPNLIHLHAAGGDVVTEIIRTDGLLYNLEGGGVMYFRPPYLGWSPAVAEAVNSNLMASLGHVGPIDSDIFPHDYRFWFGGETNLKTMAGTVISEIHRIGRGIIVLHDSTADGEGARRNNRCYELTRELVNRLSADGYRFVGLDEIPAIREAAAQPLVCGLKASNSRYVSVEPGGRIMVNAPGFDAWERIIVEHVLPGRVALRTPDGRYFSVAGAAGSEVTVSAGSIGDSAIFDVIPVDRTRIAFRTANGHFLTRETTEGGRLMANGRALDNWEVFDFKNHSI